METGFQLIRDDGTIIPLPNRDIAIGRSPTNDIVIPGKQVSRHHATLRYAAGKYWIRDEGSALGTFVNGVKIPGQIGIKIGDSFQIGPTSFRLAAIETDQAKEIPARGGGKVSTPLVIVGVVGVVVVLGVLGLAMGGGTGERQPQGISQPTSDQDVGETEIPQGIAPATATQEMPTPTEAASPQPDLPSIQTRASEKDGMMQVYVPEGTFLMGSSGDSMAKPDENPQHEVYLDAFWIDQWEVTNEMFAAFLNGPAGNQLEDGVTWLDANGRYVRIHEHNGTWEPDPGYESHPVADVTWYGARAYCEWAGRRLPTEAEWEKAARYNDARVFPWGDSYPTCSVANINGCEESTREVGSYPEGASPYGAFDMTGNLWEWVLDWYGEDYYANSPDRNPSGPADGTQRVVRGSSWNELTRSGRSANRGKIEPVSSLGSVGFRCADEP
ncbi:MAG: SUMF1/EgtB/PvdO family nonheme iron enzyme [Anaerolineales bacterium]|jgi:formylglycine-generating enzyme required for sulfatase activity